MSFIRNLRDRMLGRNASIDTPQAAKVETIPQDQVKLADNAASIDPLNKSKDVSDPTIANTGTTQTAPVESERMMNVSPNPNWGPPQNYGPPPPGHHMQQTLGNAGMQIGMADAMFNANGPSMGNGIVDGMVVGGMIGQRVDQARNHAYWRQRKAEYLNGNEAAVVNPGVPMSAREARRQERRKRRWDRRG